MRFDVNTESNSGRFPHLAKPLFVGEFGTDFETGNIHPGRSRIRYFHLPSLQKKNVNFDLDAGFDIFRPKPDVDEHLDGLLKYILSISEPGSRLKKVVHDTDFVGWRGTLTRIACTPFEQTNSDGWKVLCAVKDDVIFMCELSTEKKIRNKASQNDRGKHMTYWGYKFEQYVTTENCNEEPNTSEAVTTMENYSAVFRLDLGHKKDNNHVRIFTGGEVDCINENGDFIELKTQFRSLGIGRFWGNKEMKWWLQSFLVGIDNLVVGFRTDDGVVERLEQVRVADLGRRPKDWDPAVCLNFLLSFLNKIKAELKNTSQIVAEFDPVSKSYTIGPTDGQDLPNIFIPEFTDRFL